MKKGVYPVMLTPYRNGEIDEIAVRGLVDWYAENGCTGIFAVCQSSEMMFLSLKERVRLAKIILDQNHSRLSIVASGHCANSIAEQAEEMEAMAETGIEAFVWVSNRLDLHNDGDDVWIENAEKLLSMAKTEIPLGIYECPMPYKRLLTPRILDWCLEKKRFRFIKDTCCDPNLLRDRLKQLEGSDLWLYNANAQTLLDSLRHGAAGYSSIMANFHPELYAWLCEHFDEDAEKAERIFNVLSMMAYTESPAYPCSAKAYQQKYGVPMTLESRSCDFKRVTPYVELMNEQLHALRLALQGMLKG